MTTNYWVRFAVALLLGVPAAQPQTGATGKGMESCPMHNQGANHHAVVEKHGDQGMGFSHQVTTHHFRLSTRGGIIEVTANRSDDSASMEAIHSHLSHIAVMFRNGNFSIPMFVHDGIPPGVTTMKLLKSRISYRYEEIASGGRVHIESKDPIAIAAVHDFLRFQIAEHQTGDSVVARTTP
jgi:hypothetical protein